MPVIEANNVSIKYITGDLRNIGLKEYIMRNIQGNYHVKEFWADRDISFALEKGDMLGVIGTNGAGKSTLLKAISGIMVPTKGKMVVRGNVAALLELASGFDGDLTVRENAYLRGAMLGYTREFMDKQYENIIKFAELENFQDSLFKQLSSGMKSRLAFSIACLVDPDVIILDEVLSVGDGAFKDKSAMRMKEILASGVTGILVSHSLPQVREMCNKILWLDHGIQIGFTENVKLYCDAYEEFLRTKELPNGEEEIAALAQKRQNRLQIAALSKQIKKQGKNMNNKVEINDPSLVDDNSTLARKFKVLWTKVQKINEEKKLLAEQKNNLAEAVKAQNEKYKLLAVKVQKLAEEKKLLAEQKNNLAETIKAQNEKHKLLSAKVQKLSEEKNLLATQKNRLAEEIKIIKNEQCKMAEQIEDIMSKFR